MDVMKTLKELKKEVRLSPVHIMLLANTGSMTILLKALFENIYLKTEVQEIRPAGSETAHRLEIKESDDVNYRVVTIMGHKALVHAVSYTSISRLEKDFFDDFIRKDMPIGSIMAKHHMESRREILGFNLSRANFGSAERFSISIGEILLERNYNIIWNKKPLINITETFPYNLVEP